MALEWWLAWKVRGGEGSPKGWIRFQTYVLLLSTCATFGPSERECRTMACMKARKSMQPNILYCFSALLFVTVLSSG
jgi:hypothetical protein